jgi:hypothetical protein
MTKTVTGPYRDPRNRTRPWAVTVQSGKVIWTERFNQPEQAATYAKEQRA